VKARWLLLPLLAGSMSACTMDLQFGESPGTGSPAPPCRMVEGQTSGGLVLTAQSVPTAQVLPCLRRLPEGWTVGGFNARKGRTRLWLTVGRENRTALNVVLQRRCDLNGFAEVQSDVAGAVRFDRQTSSGAVLRGNRAYVYPGSCLRYDYALLDASALPVIKTAIGTIDRSDVAARVDQDSGGHLRLDPAPGRTS
jgi:hypothetical protein